MKSQRFQSMQKWQQSQCLQHAVKLHLKYYHYLLIYYIINFSTSKSLANTNAQSREIKRLPKAKRLILKFSS